MTPTVARPTGNSIPKTLLLVDQTCRQTSDAETQSGYFAKSRAKSSLSMRCLPQRVFLGCNDWPTISNSSSESFLKSETPDLLRSSVTCALRWKISKRQQTANNRNQADSLKLSHLLTCGRTRENSDFAVFYVLSNTPNFRRQFQNGVSDEMTRAWVSQYYSGRAVVNRQEIVSGDSGQLRMRTWIAMGDVAGDYAAGDC